MEVYQLLPAPALRAAWLQKILLPAACAAGVTDPRGVDLVPLRRGTGGQSPGKGAPPRGRVAITHKACFWSTSGLVAVYLHESAHALIEEVDPDTDHGHDAAFAVTYTSMLLRLDLAKYRHTERAALWIDELQVYDLGTPTAHWKEQPLNVWFPRELSWVLRTAGELVDLGLDARELAAEACVRYAAQAKAWEREPLQEMARTAAAARLQHELATATATAKLGLAGTGVLAVLLALMVLVR